MIFFAYIILFFTVVQLIVAISNLLFYQSFSRKKNDNSPKVSVIIPARNEEENINALLSDIINQEYNNIEVIVFNDQSTDNTAQIVNEFIQKDKRIRQIHSDGLPKGWLGKNYACYSAATNANGEFLLFLDADVRIKDDIISNTTTFIKKYKLALLTIFPKQTMLSWGEYFTIPNMNYILLSLLPLILVRKSKYPSLAAANGQFMLFSRKAYQKYQPHEKMKTSKVEDIEIARFLKNKKEKVACLVGDDTISCRMYSGIKEAVNGFSKNVIMFFGNSFLLAILFWVITTFGFIFIYLFLPFSIFLLYITAFVLTRLIISKVSRQNILKNIVLIIPQQVAMGLFIFKAIVNTFNKQYQWKGRNIS